MKHNLIDILVCPSCKSTMTISVSKEKEEEIIEGTLDCSPCNQTYPIKDSIPIFLSSSERTCD